MHELHTFESLLHCMQADLPIHEECDIVFSLIGAQEPIKNISKDATELTLDSREREIVVCYCSNNYIRTERTGKLILHNPLL